ncbi:MAG: Gfo/Idh/MocA family oxidoreductase [Caldilineaceae bacterium]|nr:Gfo/Idh/MocA family oxidoreductase [Caldilineaceae bacterium]
MQYSACVIGGGSGGQLSMAALEQSDHFELVAMADLNPDVCAQAKARYPQIETFRSHEELFAALPTDVVCVSTYPPSHETVAMAALALPLKGILVEKPLGHTAASGQRILAAIKARNLPMATPHGLLVSAAPLEIIARVQRGEIGDLKLVEIQNTRWDIINAGIHWLNFFVRLTDNEPIDHVMAIAEASTRTYRDGMQVETTAVTYAQTKSGIRVVMNTGDDVLINQPGKNTLFRIIGTEGLIEFWGWENEYRLVNAEFPAGQTIVPPETSTTRHQRHLERLAAMIDSVMIDSVIVNGAPLDYTIPESSLMALEICEAAYLSSRHRCKVTFPFNQFTPPQPTDELPEWQPGEPYAGVGGGRDGRKLG